MTTVVLVHGACHGPWCWDRVLPLLADFRVVTPDLYGAADPSSPELVQLAVDAAGSDGPVIVVGHSFGGYAITQLDTRSVSHLVYLAAIAPSDEPEDNAILPVADDFFEMMHFDEGLMFPRLERARELFYADCRDADVEYCMARLRTHPSSAVPAQLARVSYRQTPSTYVVCEQDRTMNHDYMRAVAARMTHQVSWPTSHSPMFSQPQLLADLVSSIAAAPRPAKAQRADK